MIQNVHQNICAIILIKLLQQRKHNRNAFAEVYLAKREFIAKAEGKLDYGTQVRHKIFPEK